MELKPSLQRNQIARAQSEYVMNVGLLENHFHVFNFFAHAVIVAEWTAQTAARAIWEIDGERVGQCSSEL